MPYCGGMCVLLKIKTRWDIGDPRLTDALCSAYALELGEMLQIDLQDAETESIADFHQSCLQRLGVSGDS